MLDVENQRWDKNVIGELMMPRSLHAVVTMDTVGTYIIGGAGENNSQTTEFLEEGATKWVAGPPIYTPMTYPCAVKVSQLSFLTIFNYDILEYQVDVRDPTLFLGWQSASKWPRLQTQRRHHSCSMVNQKVIIAGGYSSSVSSPRGEICPSRHSRQESKIFASGVNFSEDDAIYNINQDKKYILS